MEGLTRATQKIKWNPEIKYNPDTFRLETTRKKKKKRIEKKSRDNPDVYCAQVGSGLLFGVFPVKPLSCSSRYYNVRLHVLHPHVPEYFFWTESLDRLNVE